LEPKKTIRVVAAEIEREGRFLITQRRPTAVLPLLWEFPSGRVETDERDEDALVREIREEMDIEVRVGKLSMFIAHEPQMPSRQERLNVRLASVSFLILISASRTIGPQLPISTS